MPVSYTQLDVYKRQRPNFEPEPTTRKPCKIPCICGSLMVEVGQKRMLAKEFMKVLEQYPDGTLFVDLFGGSGLLSHSLCLKLRRYFR